ncbi:MAG: hypothetical protein R6V19_09310 [Armatimonadota bacterium]
MGMSEKSQQYDTALRKVLIETEQDPELRQALIRELEEKIGRRVVTFFTSFRYPASIDDEDADMLEDLLTNTDLSDGLALVINSGGGAGLTTEKIIQICKTYGNGEFITIVPKMAKSAATMICLGSSEIWMAETAELGPVEPQFPIPDTETGYFRYVQARNIIESYESLIKEATETDGNVEPYLQQLQRYDPRIIEELKDAESLSEDISISALKEGMMNDKSKEDIKQCVQVLLDPKITASHGRAIYPQTAKDCGLKIRTIRPDDEMWPILHELYVRTNHFVRTKASKAIETRNAAYRAVPPSKEGIE